MKLTQQEQLSSAWKKIREHYTQRLLTLRERNDSTIDPAATEKLRGRIAEVKRLLALDNEETSSAEDFNDPG